MDNSSDQSLDNSSQEILDEKIEEKLQELVLQLAEALANKDIKTAKFLYRVGRLIALKMEAAERQSNAQSEDQCSEIIDPPNSSINSNPDG